MELKTTEYKPPTYRLYNTNVTINIPGLSLKLGSYPNAGLQGLSFGGIGLPLNLLGAARRYRIINSITYKLINCNL
jgi:hypothetical protein